MARPEVTGKKLGTGLFEKRNGAPNKEEDEADAEPPLAPIPLLALTIQQFCEAFNISEGFFYKLKKQGLGPREMKVGTRTLITIESAKDWGRERERITEAEARTTAKSAKNVTTPISRPVTVRRGPGRPRKSQFEGANA